MEVHSHCQETLGMNKEADKVYNPEFKDTLAPPSSQISEGENITVAPATDLAHDENEITNYVTEGVDLEAATNATTTFPQQTSALDTIPSETNFQSYELLVAEQTSGHGMDQVAEQEEAFDDMVTLEDGMVTSATLQGYADVQIGDFQQAPLTYIFPTAHPSDNIANFNFDDANGTMQNGIPATEVPANVVSEVTLVSEVTVVSEVQDLSAPVSEVTPEPANIQVSASPTVAVEAAIPAVEPLRLPLDSDRQEEIITAEQLPNSNPAKVKLSKSTEVVTEENIQAIKGQKVLKKFGRKSFGGEVVDYDPENNWFKVVYEDGDEEEVELSEVKLILASSANNVASSSRKRSHTEGGTDEIATKSSKKAKRTGAESTIKKESKSVSKSSAKTPGSGGKDSKSTLKKGTSPGKMTKKAGDSSAFKTPDSSQGRKGKGQGTTGTSTSKSGKRGASRKRKSIKKVSRSLDLQTPMTHRKGKSKANAESSGTKKTAKPPAKAEDTPKQTLCEAKRKPEGIETTGSTKTKRLKKRTATESPKGEDAMHVGKHVKKDFDGMLYNGVVMKFNKNTQYYKVKYEDGDQEDLELHELEPILVQEAGSTEDEGKGEPTAKRSSLSAIMSEGLKLLLPSL